MDQNLINLINEILETEELDCIPFHHVKEVGFYDNQYGWQKTTLDDFIDIYEDGIYEEMDISRINYYIDYDSFIDAIYKTTKKLLEGIE